jgi:hypothetical protein
VLGGLGNIQQYKLIIYNRWGQEIFSTTDPAKKWNGLLKGLTADPGVYVWMAEVTLRNQPMRREKGTVVLVR